MWWNKKAVIISLILCGCSTTLSAQQDSITPFDKGNHHLYITTRLDLNASSLTNDFIGQFNKGAYLTDDLRIRNSRRLNESNIAGYSLDGGMYYFFAPNHHKGKFGYYIGIEEHSFAEIDFKKSFFDLVFFGNEPYSGQSVYFNDMKLNMMSWQQVKAGIFKVYMSDYGVHQIGGAIGFNIGQKNLSVEVRTASLFTQENGEYIDFNVDMDIHKSDSNQTQIGSFNGYGGAIDLSYNYSDLKQHEFQFRLSNLGYIRWDRSPDNFTRDTALRYDGFDADMFDLDQPMFDENFGDSLVSEIIGSDQRKEYSTLLPMELDMTYTYFVNYTRFSITAEIRHKFFSVYKPYFLISPGCHFYIKKSTLSLYPVVSYGGYGTWNFGLNLSTQIKGKTYIGLGTSTLNSLISPKNAAGLSGFFTLYQSL